MFNLTSKQWLTFGYNNAINQNIFDEGSSKCYSRKINVIKKLKSKDMSAVGCGTSILQENDSPASILGSSAHYLGDCVLQFLICKMTTVSISQLRFRLL